MKALFTSIPGFGHLHPLLPLARACVDAGHDVAIAIGAALRSRAKAAGFTFPGDAQSTILPISGEHDGASGGAQAPARQLDHDGFVPLSGILTPSHLGSLRDRVAELLQAEGDQAGIEVHQEAGTERLSDLVNKGAVFDICFTHPRVLAGMAHVLAADFKLSSLNYRAALPGQGHQALHTDWREPVTAGEFRVCNSIWLLDDFTADNGPTRVVPGSHLRGMLPKDEMPDPAAAHPNERMLLGPAGSVVIFNSHLWHGGTLNRTAAQRRALHSYFCRRTEGQQLDQQRYARAETRARLSPAARYVLGIG